MPNKNDPYETPPSSVPSTPSNSTPSSPVRPTSSTRIRIINMPPAPLGGRPRSERVYAWDNQLDTESQAFVPRYNAQRRLNFNLPRQDAFESGLEILNKRKRANPYSNSCALEAARSQKRFRRD